MSAQERLREAIDRQREQLRAAVPSDRHGAILAIVCAADRLPVKSGSDAPPDLVTGWRRDDLGVNEALRLGLEAGNDVSLAAPTSFSGDLGAWAAGFLAECGLLAEAELVLGHVETGFMRLVDDAAGGFNAWIATKLSPTGWLERADFDWWAKWLAGQLAPALAEADTQYLRMAHARIDAMAYQLGYPPDATICGVAIQDARDVLGEIIAMALKARDDGNDAQSHSERVLVETIASTLQIELADVSAIVAALTLDRAGAAWHAAVPDVAAAPLIRLGPDEIVLSTRGLTTEPLLFLARELRRRDAESYHNTAQLREDVFRQDLYRLFHDKRFVTSLGRIEIRRDRGTIRTDIDAVVFDRKTGTLGLFELKSQDPFARSSAELARQRDNMLYANRQVSGVLAWVQQHGGDDLLSRVDRPTSKRFRVQKVFPFVLGRYLAHVGDGSATDRRAAWGTWPQLLRLLDGQPARATEGNPIASLHGRLAKDVPGIRIPIDMPAKVIALGPALLVVHPSYAAYQARSDGSAV